MGTNGDVRIIQMRNYGTIEKSNEIAKKTSNSFVTFSYFDSVNIIPVEADKKDLLRSAYEKVQELRENDSDFFHSQQLMTVFSDYNGKSIIKKKQINTFWEKQSSLLFVTMINVSLADELENAINHIKNVFNGYEDQYLIYFTFEYNEIIVFFKGERFDEYSNLVMQLNYSKSELTNPLVDSITICSFAKNIQKSSDEKFGAHICLSTNNYKKLNDFLDKFKNDFKINKMWLLGRNDIEVWIPAATLKDLGKLYNDYIKQQSFKITTYKLSILIPVNNSASLQLSGENKSFEPSVFSFYDHEELSKKIDELNVLYRSFCDKLNLVKDKVFIRTLYDIASIISTLHAHQYAEDLFVCLFNQFNDFLNYMKLMCENDNVKEYDATEIFECINSFYLSCLSLISSTVHASQQFIQIPHCSAPSFEMPPKIMAYYNIVVRHIQRAFQDDSSFCGMIISPKLIDELEVNSLSLDATEPNQLISINISEKMLYNLKKTISILAHELAHFLGEKTRNRENRFYSIGAYLVSELIINFHLEFAKYIGFKGKDDIPSVHIQNVSNDVIKKLFPIEEFSNQVLYRKSIIKIFSVLPQRIFNDIIVQNELFEQLYNNQKSSFLKEIGGNDLNKRLSLPNTKNNVFATVCDEISCEHAKVLYYSAIERFKHSSSFENLSKNYYDKMNDYIGYLFSEAYADISMILLFNLKKEDYCNIILDDIHTKQYRDIQEDKIELMRIATVSIVLHHCKIWRSNKKIGRVEENTWDDIVNNVMSLLDNDEKLISFLKSKKIDIMLINFLNGYLFKCVGDIKAYFEKNSDNVSKTRDIYKKICESNTMYEILEEIRNMELKAFDS